MGDFNYGGRYVPQNLQNMLTVDRRAYLHRVINDNVGTSVRTKLPYDRIYAGLTPRTQHGSLPAIGNHGVDTFRDSLSEYDVSKL